MDINKDIYFPHEKLRQFQDKLINEIYTAIEKKSHLLAQAPTGTGKTASAISPALSYVINNKKEKLKVIFITPKHTQHRIAVETAKAIKEKYSLTFSIADLIGKRWLCAQRGAEALNPAEFSEYCREMIENNQCNYHANFKSKAKSIQTEQTINELKKQILHVENQREISAKAGLCPYETACLIAQESKLIIADYHHILNPSIREAFLKNTYTELNEAIIIVDEAHNLTDKTREIMSSESSAILMEAAYKEAHGAGYKEISSQILEIKNSFEMLSREKIPFQSYESKITKEDFYNSVNKIVDYQEIIGNLEMIAEDVIEIKKRSFCLSLSQFLQSWLGPDESFVRIIKKGFTLKGKPNIKIVYRCLDPSIILKPLADSCYSFIGMSATLSPLDIYSDIFGISTSNIELPNPFPAQNKLTIIIPDTTTKFTQRGNAMFQKISDYCSKIINSIPGSTAVFFPSYDLRDKIYNLMQEKLEKTTFLETPNMNKQDKSILIEKFKNYKDAGAVLLAASSGNFGEGLDLKDNLLKCVIVVGLPLGKPDIETQELINYYDKKYGKGWDYGYTLPALTKCLQNAGRCIRSETDKGVIIYLDERFTWQGYYKYFPRTDFIRISKEPLPLIKEFFNTNFPK